VDGIVYFGSIDKYLYLLDARNWGQRLKFLARNGVVSSPVVSNDIAYVCNQDGNLIVVNAQARN
jgi:outer membrane protein assembly factor BamB